MFETLIELILYIGFVGLIGAGFILFLYGAYYILKCVFIALRIMRDWILNK